MLYLVPDSIIIIIFIPDLYIARDHQHFNILVVPNVDPYKLLSIFLLLLLIAVSPETHTRQK